jgi:hypothetical protein
MKLTNCFFFLSSTLLYFLPFYSSPHCWWMIFIFPIPFLYTATLHNISFIHGYVWGLCVYTLHLTGGIYTLLVMAHGAWLKICIFIIFLLLYQALVPALLCAIAAWIIKRYAVQSYYVRLTIWSIVLFLFFIWTDWYSLWIFGVKEGYPLMHPLLPLAQHPQLLLLVPWCGKLVVTGLLLLVPLSCVAVALYKNGYTICLLCCALLPWILCWQYGNMHFHNQAWQSRITSLPCIICCSGNDITSTVKLMAHHCKQLITVHDAVDIIIMPESACNYAQFVCNADQLQLLSANYIGKKIHIIFGASRQHDDAYYNTMYWVYDGLLHGYHDKKHAMLISETLPWWISDQLYDVYFTQTPPITRSVKDRSLFFLSSTLICVPYICSELFYAEHPDNDYGGKLVIAIVNDALFVDYIAVLLVLLARYRALSWRQTIVYVSYIQSLFVDEWGMTKCI